MSKHYSMEDHFGWPIKEEQAKGFVKRVFRCYKHADCS
ncbi:hypothetical protein PATA110616_20775 [Paenibacillus tarimensis]